jgi:SAM-dependent methyltransferase
MTGLIEQKGEQDWGLERLREYARGHKKYAGLMYGGTIKVVQTLGISGRFLDMGAGPGFLTVMMAQKYPDISITAVDISPHMALVANEYIVESNLEDRIQYVVGDAGNRDFMNKLGKFDFVYSTFCLHDWRPPDDAVRNLWEAVKDGGFLYLLDFRRPGFLRYLPIKDEGFEAMKLAYTRDEIKPVLRKAGITDYRIKSSFAFLFQSVIACK